MRPLRPFAALVVLTLLPAAASSAATSFTVFNTADSGAQSLRAVIEAINANNTETVFNLNFNVGSNQTILINSNLPRIGRPNSFITIDGSLSPGLSIDGQGSSSLFYANQNALLIVRDLTLMRGESSEGGCLRAGTDGPPMTVQRVLFSGCIAGIGSGGAISASAQLNVTDSVFIDNHMNGMSGVASGGGAIIKTGSGNLIVEGSSFIDNAALGDGSNGGITLLGGAIYIADSSLNHAIRGSWFSGNLATNPGGSGNGYGGAIHLENGGLTVERSFFRGNQADREGGAITAGAFVNANAQRIVQVRNSTFERNRAGSYGGAISVSNPGNASGVLDVRNSLFQFNDAPDGYSLRMTDNVGTMTVSHSAFGAPGLDGSGTAAHCLGSAQSSNQNAGLQPLQLGCGLNGVAVANFALIGTEPTLPASFPVAYDMALSSPLVDAGVTGAGNLADPAACLTSDARGQARPQSIQFGVTPRCDIGPVELLGPLFSDGFED